MADRGTYDAVVDAEQIQYGDYEHLVWPGHPSDFGATFTAIYFGPW